MLTYIETNKVAFAAFCALVAHTAAFAFVLH